ncbi:MAG: VCBS repeat-containing protein [Syntrophobacterales bacterium]|nr:VCBS repeat-containing protein [Syntrophobacterales bacterium]
MNSSLSKTYHKLFMLGVILCLILGVVSVNNLAFAQKNITRIAISQFSIQAPPDLNYLQKGIQNLLMSRISVPGKIDTIASNIPVTGFSPGISIKPEDAKKIASTLGANHLIAGTITAIGESVSIDAWLYNLTSGEEPKKFSAQGITLSQVIPQVDLMAKEIITSLGVSQTPEVTPSTVQKTPQQQTGQSRVMEVLANPLLEDQRISYLNPNFLEITPEESFQNMGVWRSQTIPEGIIGMDVGDVDGDGIQEIVTISPKKLSIFKRAGTAMKLVGAYEAGKLERFIWCSLIDLNGDGRSEIALTVMQQQNAPIGGYTEQMTRVATGSEIPSSIVLSLQGSSLQAIAKNIPFFINTFTTATGDKILIGQRQAPEKGFLKGIYEMRLKGSKLEPIQELQLPSKCNVFNCAVVDIDNDGVLEYVIILPDNRMLLTKANGSVMWKSRHRFGATTNYVLGKEEDPRYNQQDYYYVPTPILVTDLNKDGKKEIVTNRSPEYSRLLPAGFKYYEAGQIVSLSWDQIGLIENWTTRDLSGMVTSVRIADTNGDKIPELVVSVVMGKELLQIWKTESVILAYDLNMDKKTSNKVTEAR